MSARATILAELARRQPGDAAAVAARLAAHDRNLVPQRGQLAPAERVDLFVRMAEGVQASVARVADLAAVPGAVAAYLAQHNLPTTLRAAPHPLIAALPWGDRPLLSVQTGPAARDDAVGLNVAFAGVAETGTLALRSGVDSPITTNFVPDVHIAVLPAARVVPAYEDVWDLLRTELPPGQWPRAVNFVTGPSRTADIEQRMILGAHGPRRLHIVLVGDASPG